MKRVIFAVLSAVILVCTSCLINKLNDAATTIDLKQDIQGKPVTITVSRGTHWVDRLGMGPFMVNVIPQMTFWIESPDGRFIETVYITGAAKKYDRNATRKKMGEQFYRECFPVWSRRMLAGGGQLPSETNAYPDAITSATPESSYTVKTKVPPGKARFILFAEINKSSDTNAAFTLSNNSWVGQPSVIYAAAIGDTGTYTLRPVGHSGYVTDYRGVVSNFTGIDTALHMVSTITVTLSER
ncbi:MAG: hypothetical protein HZC28_19340 [Spirochaetes bacterium]|nr:hypothetical protein [Spirochaetota bacterium]